MIVNVWEAPPPDAAPLLSLAHAAGWRNLPMSAHDVRVAWTRAAVDASGGTLLRRHLPSRSYSAVAPSFDALMDALAWEAHEWIAIEAWRARRKTEGEDVSRPAAPAVR
jgi:hypothetical protein